MKKEPIEAFEWLLAAFHRYTRNQITWLEVGNVLREADALLVAYQQSDDTADSLALVEGE